MKPIFKTVKTFTRKHSAEIKIGLGVSGMWIAGIMGVRATIKAVRIVDETAEELGVEKLEPKEIVEVTWKCYIPSIATAALSTTFLIWGNIDHIKREAAISAAYNLVSNAYKEYREQTVKTVGKKKESEIRNEIAKKKLEQTPLSTSQVYVTSKGQTLFFDVLSGRYFKSTIEQVNSAVNNLNFQMLSQDYVSLSDFYDELKLEHTKMSDELGWCTWTTGKVEIDTSSARISEDGDPCIVMDYLVAPVRDYNMYA